MTSPRWETRLEANRHRQKLPEPNWQVIWPLTGIILVLIVAGAVAGWGFQARDTETLCYAVAVVLAGLVLIFRFNRRLFVWSPRAS